MYTLITLFLITPNSYQYLSQVWIRISLIRDQTFFLQFCLFWFSALPPLYRKFLIYLVHVYIFEYSCGCLWTLSTVAAWFRKFKTKSSDARLQFSWRIPIIKYTSYTPTHIHKYICMHPSDALKLLNII